MMLAVDRARTVRPDHYRRLAALLLDRSARPQSDALHRRPARRKLAHRLRQRHRERNVRRRVARAEFRVPQPGEHVLEEALQPLFEDRHRGRPLSRFRALVGRARQSHREGNAVHRGRAVRRQQARRRPGQVIRRDRDRPAQHPLADRGVLFEGRQHHASAAGAGLDTASFTTMSTRSAPMARRSSTASTKASVISVSSSPAVWRARSTASSRAISISSTCCRPASTRRCSRQNPRTPPIPNSRPANGSCAARCARSTISARSAETILRTIADSRPSPGCRRPISRCIEPSRSRSCAHA